jgi:general secretion pathway protein J
MKHRASQLGFTLLEVMIAMTLSVLLLAIVTAGMRTVVDEWQDRSTGPFEEQVDTRLILLQIEQALLGAAPHSYIDQDTLERNVFFVGLEDSLTWVSSISPQARQQLTAWQLSGAEREGVILKSAPAYADDPTERLENTSGTLILPDYELTVSYLDIDEVERPEWLEEWSGIEYQLLPMAVRLRLTNPDVDSDREFALIVPLLHRQHEEIQPVDTQ